MAGDLPMGLGAFVAPDEKSIEKMAKRPQTSLKEVLSKKYFDHPIVPRFLKAEGNYSKFRYDITCKPGGVSLEKLKEIIRKGVKVAKG